MQLIALAKGEEMSEEPPSSARMYHAGTLFLLLTSDNSRSVKMHGPWSSIEEAWDARNEVEAKLSGSGPYSHWAVPLPAFQLCTLKR